MMHSSFEIRNSKFFILHKGFRLFPRPYFSSQLRFQQGAFDGTEARAGFDAGERGDLVAIEEYLCCEIREGNRLAPDRPQQCWKLSRSGLPRIPQFDRTAFARESLQRQNLTREGIAPLPTLRKRARIAHEQRVGCRE